MAWSITPRPLHPATLGFRAQLLSMGGAFGPALALLAQDPYWLLTLARARAVAAGSEEARLALDTLFAELATATGAPVPRWPPHFDRSHPAPAPADLPEDLDPSQHLLLDPGERACPHTRAVAALLAQQAFGPRPGAGLSRTARIRAAAVVVPAPLRGRWLAGVSPHLPDEARDRPDARALALVRAAFPQPDAVAPCPAPTPELPGPLAADALLVALSVRLVLRQNGAIELAAHPSEREHAAATEARSSMARGPARAPAGATTGATVGQGPKSPGVASAETVVVPTGS